MEDDEEIQSHPSPDSGSPVSPTSPPPNGRITVTVAAAPPQNTLTLALPIQQQTRTTGNGGGGGGREDCWSEGATAVLIGAWGERYVELSRGNLKQKHWKEVADIVSSREDYTKTPKTDIQCKNRIDTVKKKYKSEKSKIAAGGGPSKWPFYNRLDELIGPTAKPAPNSGAGTSGVHKVPIGIPVGIRSFPQFQQQQTQRQKQKQKQKQKHPIESESESEPPSPISADSFPPETYRPNLKRPRTQREFNNPNPNQNFVRPVVSQGNNRDGGGGGGGERREKNWGNSVRELTKAIVKFGEAYEQTESSKLQQLVEMEKQRMKFAKELELQRMQFFMKTQLELSQLKKQRRRVGNNNSNHHHHHHHHSSNNNNNNNINNNSDSSS